MYVLTAQSEVGERAFQNGKKRGNNPYACQSWRKLWFQGWDKECKAEQKARNSKNVNGDASHNKTYTLNEELQKGTWYYLNDLAGEYLIKYEFTNNEGVIVCSQFFSMNSSNPSLGKSCHWDPQYFKSEPVIATGHQYSEMIKALSKTPVPHNKTYTLNEETFTEKELRLIAGSVNVTRIRSTGKKREEALLLRNRIEKLIYGE